MMSLIAGRAWCEGRGKRLCYDDEWTRACAGPEGLTYPYGDVHDPGVCNDDETWLTYNQTLLNGWPLAASASAVGSFEEQIEIATAVSPTAAQAAEHVLWLYQAEPSGANVGCVGVDGVLDLCGNVEEWALRRDGGSGTGFTGALKGRYWAESRTCASAVTTHGDAFMFYETGFRCCADPAGG
jgi:formylglycine-generating enzyme required for sulfatase activity